MYMRANWFWKNIYSVWPTSFNEENIRFSRKEWWVGTISSDGIMSDNYGFILRTGFEGLKAVSKYIKENNNTNAIFMVLWLNFPF